MSKLLITKPSILSATKKAELRKAGYIVIETETPSEIIVREYGDIDIDRDMLLSTAIKALSWGNDDTCRNAFGNLLRKELVKTPHS